MRSKKGMTLVEMIIAIFIFTLGIAGFTLLFSKTLKSNSYVLEEASAIRSSTTALNETIKSLRKVKQGDDGSYPIKSIGDFDLVTYLDNDNDGITERVHYFLDGEQFKKGVAKPANHVYPTGYDTDQVSIVTDYVTNTAEQPIFYYYNKDYPIDQTNNPMTNPLPVDVRLIKIRLWINIKPLIAPDNINVESFVEFRNINENY